MAIFCNFTTASNKCHQLFSSDKYYNITLLAWYNIFASGKETLQSPLYTQDQQVKLH